MDTSQPGETQGQQEQTAPAQLVAPQTVAIPELVVQDGAPPGAPYQGQPYQASASTPAQPAWLANPKPSAPGSSRRWLLIGGLALAFVLALALGAFVGATLHSTANVTGVGQGAGNLPGGGAGQRGAQGGVQGPGQGGSGQQSGPVGTPGAQGQGSGQGPGQGQPGGRGQIPPLTVTSVNGDTILATAPNGNSVSVQTSASTTYTQGGQATSASAVTAGSHILVQGTRNSDGSIEATSIDVQ